MTLEHLFWYNLVERMFFVWAESGERGGDMAERVDDRVWLERQADRIERTLSGLELPVRVNGGRVSEGRVRYHVTPMGYTRAEQIEAAGADVAAALGAPAVRVARERDGLAIEVQADDGDHVRLLPLMHALGDPDPLTAVLGMDETGRPLTLPLDGDGSRHLWIEGRAGSGKSELLRTIALSTALASRPSQLQLVGVEPGGNQLNALESLPHTRAEVVRDPAGAVELTRRLAEEAEQRLRLEVDRPALALFVDDAQRLSGDAGRHVARSLRRIGRFGARVGVHVFVAAEAGLNPLRTGGMESEDAARAIAAGPPGRFRFETGSSQVAAQVAWLPAQDLATAVALASERPGGLTAVDLLGRAGGAA